MFPSCDFVFYILVLYVRSLQPDLGQHVLSSASILIKMSSHHHHICTKQYNVQVEAEKKKQQHVNW